MAEAVETNNGFSYDFGVNVSQAAVTAIGLLGAKMLTITGAAYAIIDAGHKQDAFIRENKLAMGGYFNLLKGIDYFTKKIADGSSYFDVENLMQGTRSLDRAGINMKKNFDLINKAAQGMGSDFASLSEVIRNGDYGALAEAGLITDRMARNMERMTFSQSQGTKRVLGLLRKAQSEGLFDDNFATLSQTTLRIKTILRKFVKSIVGDPKNPQGLWFNLRKGFKKFADFFNDRMAKIIKIGQMVGRVLVFLGKVVTDFVRWMYNGLRRIINLQDGFFDNWSDKMHSLTLFLEIVRIKIRNFTEEWGGLIVKLYLFSKAFRIVSLLFGGKLTSKIGKFFKLLLGGKGVLFGKKAFKGSWIYKLGKHIPKLIPLIQSLGVAIGGAFAAISWPVVIVAAIVAAVVALVYYWKDIRRYASEMSDSMIIMVSTAMPLVGLVLALAKHWDKVTNNFKNGWQVLVNIVDILVSIGKMIKDDFINKFKIGLGTIKAIVSNIDSWFSDTFGKSYDNFKKLFFDPIKKAIETIKGWFEGLEFGGFLGKIGDFYRKLANNSDSIAKDLAAQAGRESFASGGVELPKPTDENGGGSTDSPNSDVPITVPPIRPEITIPVSSAKGSSSNTSNTSNQTNNFNITVSKDVDLAKVTDAVNKANSKQALRDQRRTGS